MSDLVGEIAIRYKMRARQEKAVLSINEMPARHKWLVQLSHDTLYSHTHTHLFIRDIHTTKSYTEKISQINHAFRFQGIERKPPANKKSPARRLF